MNEKGVTLVELVIATALGAVAMVACMDVVSTLIRSQSTGRAELVGQMGAITAARIIEKELGQSNYVAQPAMAGVPASNLEGCVNAAPPPGSSTPAILNPARSIRGFAVCEHNGALYYHTGAACPLSYACGGGNGVLLAGSEGGSTTASASFLRPSPASALYVGDIIVTSRGLTTTTRATAQAAFSPGAVP